MTKNIIAKTRKVIAYSIAILLIVIIVLLINYVLGFLYTTPIFIPIVIVAALIAFLELIDTVIIFLFKNKN